MMNTFLKGVRDTPVWLGCFYTVGLTLAALAVFVVLRSMILSDDAPWNEQAVLTENSSLQSHAEIDQKHDLLHKKIYDEIR